MKISYGEYSNLLSCLEYVKNRHFLDLPLDIGYLRKLYKEGDMIEIAYTGKPLIEPPKKSKDQKLEDQAELLEDVFNGEYRIVVSKEQYREYRFLGKCKPKKEGGSVNAGNIIHYALGKLEVEPSEGLIYSTETGRVERRVSRKDEKGETMSEFSPILRKFSKHYLINTGKYRKYYERIRGPSALTKGYAVSTTSTIAAGLLLGYAVTIPPQYIPLIENSLRTIDSMGGDIGAIASGDKWGRKLGYIGLSLLPIAWVADSIFRAFGIVPTDLWYVIPAILFQCIDSITQGIINGKKYGWKDPLFLGTTLGAAGGAAAALAYRCVLGLVGVPPAPTFAALDAAVILSATDVGIMRGFMHRAEKKSVWGFLNSLASEEQLSLYKGYLKNIEDYEFAVLGTGMYRPDKELESLSHGTVLSADGKYTKLLDPSQVTETAPKPAEQQSASNSQTH